VSENAPSFVVGHGRFDAYPDDNLRTFGPPLELPDAHNVEFERPCRPCADGEHDRCHAPSADDVNCCCDELERES
jgi:hypothetical protein